MNFAELFKKASTFTDENASTLLTAAGVAGTVTTAYLTGKASFKAADVLVKDHYSRAHEAGEEVSPDRPLKEQVRLVWKLYVPAVTVGTSTIVSIVLANRISSKRAAALAAAYGISERAFSEYKEKIVEKLGKAKEQNVRDEIASKRVEDLPINTREVIIAGAGEVLFMDSITGRYFQSTMEEVKKAINEVNAEIINHMSASLSSFYDKLGLPATGYSDGVGWTSTDLLEISFTTTLTSDDRPCIVLEYLVEPTHGYQRLY